ncbi:MAG: type II toxin-antitoxin system VapC family toxin [Verrucomicrobiae bacterium]|nr:type II toxin-antitoxin system VapC family toxin [Verrucomicrobiae bacterium]
MTAEEVYVDPSALACLYVHQARSREMNAWRARTGGALPVTHHGRTEIVNAICRIAFTGHLDKAGLEEALGDFQGDFAAGRLHQADLLWRGALNRAVELSRTHTPRLGTRSLDVLHVACALELKLLRFLTFDDRQQKLAAATGLKLVKV